MIRCGILANVSIGGKGAELHRGFFLDLAGIEYLYVDAASGISGRGDQRCSNALQSHTSERRFGGSGDMAVL